MIFGFVFIRRKNTHIWLAFSLIGSNLDNQILNDDFTPADSRGRQTQRGLSKALVWIQGSSPIVVIQVPGEQPTLGWVQLFGAGVFSLAHGVG